MLIVIIDEIPYHLAEGNFRDITHYKVFENDVFQTTAASLRGEWVDIRRSQLYDVDGH